MVVRIGIGATAAAAVVFSILLASNIIVVAASQDRERLYSVSDAEDSLGEGAVALTGAGAMNILLEAQAALAARPLDCQNAPGAAAAMVGNLSDLQEYGGLTVSSTARLAQGPGRDNLTMAAPFAGSVPGEVDISVSMTASGSSLSGEVTFGKSEVHFFHLPVQLNRLSSDCVWALTGVLDALSAEAPSNCTRGAIGPLVLNASRRAEAAVAADGFAFTLSYALVPGGSCGVSLRVQVQQAGVEGPGGPFTVKLEGGGVAFFGQSASAQKGGISWRTGP